MSIPFPQVGSWRARGRVWAVRKMMLRPEREAAILRLLAQAEAGVLHVSELGRRLGVSEMTVRRDLERLDERGLVQRVRGGAVYVNSPTLLEKPFHDRGEEYHEEKEAIGRAAAAMVHDGDVVIFDAGTTTLEVARHIRARRVTAVTNALPVAGELAGHDTLSVILLGGNLKGPELCTVGPMVTTSLAQMSADLLFLSAGGFSPERGLTDADLREAEVKRAMITAARRVVLVADASKYQMVRFATIAPLDRVQAIVTDSGLPGEGRRALEALGIEVLLAEPAGPVDARPQFAQGRAIAPADSR